MDPIEESAQPNWVVEHGAGQWGAETQWFSFVMSSEMLKYWGFCIIVFLMINSQAISLSQKKKLWKEQKEEKFREISNDRCQMFNYFYNNNDIFKFIKEEDFGYYSYLMLDMMDRQANLFIASVAGVFLVDRFAINRLLPSIRFQKWRLTANVIKFLVWPSIIFNVVEYFCIYAVDTLMIPIDKKCSKSRRSTTSAFRTTSKAIKYSREPWRPIG